MRFAPTAALLLGCASGGTEPARDRDATNDAVADVTDAFAEAAVDAPPDLSDAAPKLPARVFLEPIAESPAPTKTPPTWNAHLSKLVGDASFLYAVHTSFTEEVATRYAAIMRRARSGGPWTEVARVSYPHQPPGVVMDPSGTLHMVFDCLRPSTADVTCFAGGAGTSGVNSRFYHLAFGARDGASALRFDTYANWNEWTALSNGYHGIGLLADGTVVWALADAAWGRVVQYRTPSGATGTAATLTRPSTYLLYPILFGNEATKLGLFAGEFDPAGGTNAGYPAAALFTGSTTGLTERLRITPPTKVDPGAVGAYPSDIERADDGTVYALVYKKDADRCTELLRFDGGLAATPKPFSLGCLETYAKLQLSRSGLLYVLGSGDATGMRLGVSGDRGATWTFGALAFDTPLGAGDVRIVGATLIKTYTSPKLHDPDVMTFFAAGLDAAGTSKRSYFGRVELR